MMNDRPPAVNGTFYPADPLSLSRQVQEFLAAVPPQGDQGPVPKALVLPHAGYRYSGPIAASGYAQLVPGAAQIHRVVLFGPAHRLAFAGLAIPTARRFLTPLGAVDLDRESLDTLADLPQVRCLDPAFAGEHCLEVQLPFLQTLLTSFRLVPLLVGQARPQDVEEVMERLWGGSETLILISSDLSHYLDYATAQRVDRRTNSAILRLDAGAIEPEGACGHVPLAGLLLAARRHGLVARNLDLRNSGDTAGSRDRVVGYGAYAFH